MTFKSFLQICICQTDADLRTPVYQEKQTRQNNLNFAAGGWNKTFNDLNDLRSVYKEKKTHFLTTMS